VKILQALHLSGCKPLRTRPTRFGDLKGLHVLYLGDCEPLHTSTELLASSGSYYAHR